MQTEKNNLLDQKISTLPFSDELKNILISKNIHTLNDVLKIEVYNWHKDLPGFNYHHQHEIVSYLNKNGLVQFLKEE